MSFKKKDWMKAGLLALAATGYGAPIAAGLGAGGAVAAGGAEAAAAAAAAEAAAAAGTAGAAGTAEAAIPAMAAPDIAQGLLGQGIDAGGNFAGQAADTGYTPSSLGNLLQNGPGSGDMGQASMNYGKGLLGNVGRNLQGPMGARMATNAGLSMMQPPPPQPPPMPRPQQAPPQMPPPQSAYSAPTTGPGSQMGLLSQLTPQQIELLKRQLGIR